MLNSFSFSLILRCQDVFLGALQLGPNIARNSALKENVFMMVVCIELRIPLFLVGKPGSSKSLAKTIVADAMQGDAAHSRLFKNLKQVRGFFFHSLKTIIATCLQIMLFKAYSAGNKTCKLPSELMMFLLSCDLLFLLGPYDILPVQSAINTRWHCWNIPAM